MPVGVALSDGAVLSADDVLDLALTCFVAASLDGLRASVVLAVQFLEPFDSVSPLAGLVEVIGLDVALGHERVLSQSMVGGHCGTRKGKATHPHKPRTPWQGQSCRTEAARQTRQALRAASAAC